MNVLLLSQRGYQCGVSDYGDRLFNALRKSKKINFTYSDKMELYNIDVVLYNYHNATLPHITDGYLSDKRHIKHIALHHEGGIQFIPDKIIEVQNLPRPVNKYLFVHKENEIPTIGSFGFGFYNKNYYKIAELVKAQYKKAKIRVNIPFAYYGDIDGQSAKVEVNKMHEILIGTDIELEVNHEYLSNLDLVKFLNENDINLFLFNEMAGRGLSSSIDYALEAKKPIGISHSDMFRHLTDVSSSIFVDEVTISEIIDKGIEPLKPIYEKHNSNKLLEYLENELLKG
jgi:hypothetical protein